MTLSKERLEEMISGDSSRLITVSEALAMARELRERRERDRQEPVGEVRRGGYDDVGCYPDAKVVCLHDQADWENFADGFKLYAAPPALAVPDPIEPDYDVIKGILPTSNPDEYACCIAADMWNACRAAMLKENKK